MHIYVYTFAPNTEGRLVRSRESYIVGIHSNTTWRIIITFLIDDSVYSISFFS